MEIVPNIHLIPSGFVNCYLGIDPEGVTLIDTGLSRNASAVLKYIAGLGRRPSDLKHIIITHSDGDHVGALADLKSACLARVYASPIEAQAIEVAHPSRDLKRQGMTAHLFKLVQLLFKAKPAKVDELLSDGQVLPVLGGLQVVYTIGHTPGHVSLYASATKILFSGDSIVAERNGTLRCSRGMNTWDEAKAQAAVKIQAALGAEIVCPGHGPVVREANGKFPTV
jgi:glyoxylase-like metal-dependent hydrolase (beta-lactamase superfamily II)